MREGQAEAEGWRAKSCLADKLSMFCLALRRSSLTSFSQVALAPFWARFVPIGSPKTADLQHSKK